MKQLICHLKNLVCHHCDERDGDELFIKFHGRKIWPESKKYVKGIDHCVIPINIKLPIADSKKIILQLWDYDFLTNDLLGEFSFPTDDNGHFSSDLKSSGSGVHKFTLEFEIFPVLKQATSQQKTANG